MPLCHQISSLHTHAEHLTSVLRGQILLFGAQRNSSYSCFRNPHFYLVTMACDTTFTEKLLFLMFVIFRRGSFSHHFLLPLDLFLHQSPNSRLSPLPLPSLNSEICYITIPFRDSPHTEGQRRPKSSITWRAMVEGRVGTSARKKTFSFRNKNPIHPLPPISTLCASRTLL